MNSVLCADCILCSAGIFCQRSKDVAPACEHAFCSGCINEWLGRQQTCPVDRQSITTSQLKPVPRILRTLLAKLQIACSNREHGCNAVVKLEMLGPHLEECEHNPKRPIPCEAGCGLVVPKDELKTSVQ
ncbi:hypothetical protein HAZT_HAZT004775 [Hyalella azteca]|uniref:RING-type domain-containing protein n=1 Tax=Hyalella azteca TaxID=294128 RepID=A0A6A0H894_HYAAZ|nr:hypothetical protein HAZT_HAZT004775 [Hyalella azteca]